MPIGSKLTERYEVRQTLGQGGMGVVYWAYDTLIRRDVALKTIRDAPEKAALDLFYKECNVLASISHPNIIEIFDIGKLEDDGAEKPYFVMPLLKGMTLETLIRTSSRRLTVDRIVEILCQTCRGLQAAHENGLIHRDLKPSNIFVLDDDSVKIIDFGVAHMNDGHTASAPKGTLLYMSPEQIQLKPASALSDIFALGVVAYEALTLRRPFDGPTHRDIANAILQYVPPPASDVNPAVSPLLGRVVHKTMAKQPWNRFNTARELADALQKALRNEPIAAFDSTRIQPRVERAAKAFDAGDQQFASEILTELEAEGHLIPEMAPLRRKIDQSIRQKKLSQLLESARIRVEDKEYPLALQKLQEALEIDPENAEALGMQQDIESNRSTGQVDDWYRLARQHLDQFAFSQAREAVQNVLQLRPADPQALDLMAEIDRREKQYLQLRQEKEKLYQSAVEDHEKAELSSALSKLERVLELERKAPEVSSTERSASYQSLYNQVRSEQDASMADYSEARRCLAGGNFDRAFEICGQALKKYPGHALFQALSFDIEEVKRQNLGSYIAEVDRKVAAEPDLDKRVEILRGAAEKFPDEQHFERTFRVAREKRDLVNSIVVKARRLEEQGQPGEALAQWEILRTVYGQFPGLSSEVDRVTKLRGQQSIGDAKIRFVEQIDREIEARDFVRAASLLREAQAQFPGDVELEELAKLARQGEERNAVIQALVDRSRALCIHGRFDEAVNLLRQANEADPRGVMVRGLLVDTLVQHARSVLDKDWKRAGELVQSALALDSANVQARGVSALVADKKRDEVIDQCINRVRQSQTAGDVAGALAKLEPVLAMYPTAPRLVQVKATLQNSTSDTGMPQARRDDLGKLMALESHAVIAKEPHEQRQILEDVRALAAKYLDDPEFQATLIAVEKRYVGLHRTPVPSPMAAPAIPNIPPVEARQSKLEEPPRADYTSVFRVPEMPPAPPPAPPPPPPVVRRAEVLIPEVKREAPKPPPPVPPVVPPVVPVAIPAAAAALKAPSPGKKEFATAPVAVTPPIAPPVPPYSAKSAAAPVPAPLPAPVPHNWKLWGAFVGGFALVAAMGIGGLMWYQRQQQTPVVQPVAGGVPVDFRTVPEGATILVNDKASGISNLQLKLAPGTYRINAVRDGFRPSETTLKVETGHSASASLTLQPLPTTLRLLTDFTTATISLDGKPQTNLQSGQLTLDNVAAGPHTLTIGNGTSTAAIRFDAREGAPPVVTALEAAKETSAILITNLGPQARVYSSQKTGTLTVDGKPAGSLDPLGVELNNIGPGDHEINIAEGADHRKVVYETAHVPALTVYLNNGGLQSVGTLLVITGQDNVQVSIDGHPARVGTRSGQLRIPNLQPRPYVITVSKEGFQPVPEQRVVVNKGEEAKLTFQLHPVPTISALHVTGAMPGTQVLLDGKPAGTVGQDGSLQVSQVSAGNHAIQLRRDEYKPKTFQLNFGGGKEVALTGADVALESTFGTLVVAVSPAGAQLAIQRVGDSQTRLMTGNSVHLAEGSYTVTGTSPHFVQQSTTVEIATGSTKNITLQLAPERVAPVQKSAARLGMSGWQTPWTPDGDHFTRKGGNLCLYSPQGSGTYSFTASMKHGKQMRWVAHVVNEKNYVEFELDGDNFYRRQVVDGKGKEVAKRRHGMSMQQAVSATVHMTVTPTGIVQRITGPDGTSLVDSWMEPSLHDGRVGFMIRGRDEVNLQTFSFTGSE